MGSVGPQAQSLSLRAGAASAAAAHPSTASGSPAPAIPPGALSGKRSRCRMGAKAEAVGCLLKISFSPPLPPAPAAHRVRPSSPPRASWGGRWAEQDGSSAAPCLCTIPGGCWLPPPSAAPSIGRTSRSELSQPWVGVGEVIGSSRSAGPKPQRRHREHPRVPTLRRRLARAFPSVPAAAERNRQHVQAGTRQKGRQWPPHLGTALLLRGRTTLAQQASRNEGGTSALLPQ